MRLVIDMQGCQASNAKRGIGRYVLSLAEQLVSQRGAHEVLLLLNDAFPETIEPIRAAFAGLLPEENIRVLNIAGPISGLEPDNTARREAAERLYEVYLAGLRPDLVLVSSLFEGVIDDAVTSIGLCGHLPTAVVLYDLIPYIHSRIYLANPRMADWYLHKLDHLRRADQLLAISESSAREAREHLGFSDTTAVNISTACDSRFRPRPVDAAGHRHLQDAYGIDRPFVMYTGGIDHRKNIERLIEAYARLPEPLRARHQLVIVCSVAPTERNRLLQLARDNQLADGECILTGFVPEDDLLTLYNACRLFVFPSWHEGFGLPALEAMACGRPVIASCLSSVPEVIGNPQALFDPLDTAAITGLMRRALEDEAFLEALRAHSLPQAAQFSWQTTGARAWKALEAAVARQAPPLPVVRSGRRPRLAYVSPLPPQQSGISDYSAELIPELERHYDITAIVNAETVDCPAVQAGCRTRNLAWFAANAGQFDRVLYHFGNSEFHSHMFELLRAIPGVVMLHDFFLSGAVAYEDLGLRTKPHQLARTLYHAHGWNAVRMRFDPDLPVYRSGNIYPANLQVIQDAHGIIVHSEYSRQLADKSYGPGTADDWAVIPHLRVPMLPEPRQAARAKLGLADTDIVVCSFGLLGATKCNHRTLAAWLASPLAADPRCRLVFVGQGKGPYGTEMQQAIAASERAQRITITGWVDTERYRTWLSVADVAVQLRTMSRGETSGTVLDCMGYGVPTIVNDHGTLAEMSEAVVCHLPDAFSDAELSAALTRLYEHGEERQALGQRALEQIRTLHQPRRCADLYQAAIEGFYAGSSARVSGLVGELATLEPALSPTDQARVATALAADFPPRPRCRQLLLDISELVQRDAKTGIQRVVRSLLAQLLDNPPDGWRVEPVYGSMDTPGYRYARQFVSRLLGMPEDWGKDDPVEAWPGDLFFGLDLQHHVVACQAGLLRQWRQRGVKVHFVIYDLLPVLLAETFPPEAKDLHNKWLENLAQFDGVLCISRAVADEYHDWLAAFGPRRDRPFRLNWFHLGADVENSVPTRGLPPDADNVLTILGNRPTFLMVGTVEPRKAHPHALAAVERLWAQGRDVNLVIVGKQGWMMETFVERLQTHPKQGKRLFWMHDISDEYLDTLYKASDALIAASYGEGFGLPLIEAARHKIPIIARDIPVFREVSGEHAFYFPDDKDPATLAASLTQWLALARESSHPRSDAMPWLTWKESAQQALSLILGDKAYKTWLPDGVLYFWGNDPRLGSRVGRRQGHDIHTTGKAGFLVFGPCVSLDPGSYRFVLRGQARHWTGKETVEIVWNKGTTRVLHRVLNGPAESPWELALEHVVDCRVEDLEVRFSVDIATDMTLTGYCIAPVRDEGAEA